jgi:hypothetical protein
MTYLLSGASLYSPLHHIGRFAIAFICAHDGAQIRAVKAMLERLSEKRK